MSSRDNEFLRGYERKLIKNGNTNLYRRHIPIPPGCWMCNRDKNVKMSKEHIIPDWLLKEFNCGEEVNRQGHVGANGLVIDTREVMLASLRQGNICKVHCNEGWMSNLEKKFKKEFLSDWQKNQELNPILFARWIAKTMSIINISQIRRIQIPAAARHGLKNIKNLPEGWHIYVYKSPQLKDITVSWEQGPITLAVAPQEMNVKHEMLGDIFGGCILINDFVGVAFWVPDGIINIEPALPMRRLWPEPSGILSSYPWGGAPSSNLCLVDLGVDNSIWESELRKIRKFAKNIFSAR